MRSRGVVSKLLLFKNHVRLEESVMQFFTISIGVGTAEAVANIFRHVTNDYFQYLKPHGGSEIFYTRGKGAEVTIGKESAPKGCYILSDALVTLHFKITSYPLFEGNVLRYYPIFEDFCIYRQPDDAWVDFVIHKAIFLGQTTRPKRIVLRHNRVH